jgi:hypothetical protein|tara:strand:+ start:387 stop:560 length:174 start_codon:yes stop_codon:yes gene_type:complete
MRCKACNVLLEDREVTLKDKKTGEFLDLCGECLHESNEAIFDQEQPEFAVFIDDPID